MNKEYKETTQSIYRSLETFRNAMPPVMEGFDAMAGAATQDGVLSKKTKELIALALGVAAHCQGCISYHTHVLAQLDTNRQEVLETLAMAIYMGGGPSLMYAADALNAFDDAIK